MRHWEKNSKKDLRQTDDRNFRQQEQDHKKKKLKPLEKLKYKAKGFSEQDSEE